MGATIYKKAFSVELSHDFFVYPGPPLSPATPPGNEYKVNRNFEIVPTQACAALLQNGRMRFVRTNKGFTVFYKAYVDETNTEQPLIKVDDNSEFLFNVRLVNDADQFLNVTDLNVGSKKYGAGMKYFLQAKDTDPDTVLDESLINLLCPSVLTYSFRGKLVASPFTDFTGTVDITVKDESGATVFTFNGVTSDPATGIYNQPLDFTGKPNGIYFIEAKDATSPFPIVHQATLYVDSSLARENNFGLIRLTYADADHLYDGEEVYTFEYTARSVAWRYFISIKEDPGSFFTSKHLALTDTAGTYTFTPLDSPGVPHGSFVLNGGYFCTVIFTSSVDIKFNESAITTLKLSEVTGGTLIPVLPNATLSGVDSNRLDPTNFSVAYAEIFVAIDTVN